MAWSGGVFTRTNGVYTGTTVWVQDAAANILILANRHDTHDQDLATGINSTLNKAGQNSPTANISWGSFKITDLGNGTASADAATYGQTITALSWTAATRTLTATRAAGSLTAVVPLVTTADPGLVPAPVTVSTRFFRDDGTWSAIPVFTASVSGAVPAPVTPANKVLRDDATWAEFSAPAVSISTKAASFTAVRDSVYFITAGSLTATLPASPVAGDSVYFVLIGALSGVVVGRNGQNIMGQAADMTIDFDNAAIGLTFHNTANGWRII